jgi:hypothetical protein
MAGHVLQHLHIGSGQLFCVGDDGDLAWQGWGGWHLHRLRQSQLGNALVDVAEQGQALITREMFHSDIRCQAAPQGLQGLGGTRHGLAVPPPNGQVLIILQNELSQIL